MCDIFLFRISNDPMEAIKLAEKSGAATALEEEKRMNKILASEYESAQSSMLVRLKEITKILFNCHSDQRQDQRQLPLETVILEKTLIRLGELLVLGTIHIAIFTVQYFENDCFL